MTPAEAVFEAMTAEYQTCERCGSPFGLSWPADPENCQPHEWYCRDCLQSSCSNHWGLCVDGVIRPMRLSLTFVWRGTLED